MRQYVSYVGTMIGSVKILSFDEGANSKLSKFKCRCFCGKVYFTRCRGIVKSSQMHSCGCLKGSFNILPDNANVKNTMYRWYKSNARKKPLSFQLTKDEFFRSISQSCHYCGSLPKERDIGWGLGYSKRKTINANGIDRVDNSVGYIMSNCVPCCRFCNDAKKNVPLQDFLAWTDRLVAHKIQQAELNHAAAYKSA
jgi:hypothetical protein